MGWAAARADLPMPERERARRTDGSGGEGRGGGSRAVGEGGRPPSAEWAGEGGVGVGARGGAGTARGWLFWRSEERRVGKECQP